MKPTKQGIFFRSLENHDSISTMKFLKHELDCSWIGILVQAGASGTQQMNLKDGTDKWLANYVRDAKANNMTVFAYHEICGSDPALEAKKLITRLSSYSIGGVIAIVTDAYSQRTENSVKVYCDALKKAGIGVGWLNMAAALDPRIKKAWLNNAEFHMRFVRDWADCIQEFVSYGIGNEFIPVFGICDVPERVYKFTKPKVLEFWDSFMKQDMRAIGMWNATPKGVSGIFSDGDSSMQTIKKLKWTAEEPVIDPPVELDDKVEPDPEEEETIMDVINGIPMVKGNDISRYNEVIKWPDLKAAGHRYTIIRSGQGPSYKDPFFAIHRNNAIANNMPWGVYHFFDYRWPDGAAHFQNMQSVVGKNFGNIAPSIDLETLYNYTPATKKKPAKATAIPISCGRNTVYNELMEFGAMLFHETGRKPMLYVGNLLGWLKPDKPFMDMFDLWFAYWSQIPGKTTPFIDWTCWQKMGDVVIPGQRGVWDIDYVKEKDWANFVGSEEPEIPLPEELSLEEKVERLWAAHQELHV